MTILSLRAADASLGGSRPFRFYITTLDWVKDYATFSDRVPDSSWYAFDPAHVRFQSDKTSVTIPPHAATAMPVWSPPPPGGFTSAGTEQGLLIVHRNNAPGAREVDTIAMQVPMLYLPYFRR